MHTGDLGEALNKQIQLLSAHPEKINCDPCHYIYLESSKTLNELRRLIAQLPLDKPLNESILLPMRIFLANRWRRIQATNAIYSCHPKTYANQICMRLAEIIAVRVNRHPYQILMPTLLDNKGNYPFDLRQTVMSDDNKKLIDVVLCLERAERDKTTNLFHTHAASGEDLLLNDVEKKRVINFTPRSQRYYKEIEAQSSQIVVNKAHRRFKNLAGFSPVRALYPDSAIRLQANLYPDLAKGIMDALVKNLLTYGLSAWPCFLENISLQTLERMMLKSHNLGDAVVNKSFYQSEDENYNRAVLFIFLHIYRLKRASEGTYKSLWGKMIGLADTKDTKLSSTNFPYQFLLSGEKLNKYPHCKSGPLASGYLGIITKQIAKVSDASYFKRTFSWLPKLI